MDIGWYHIFDASNKTYIFPDSTVIASHENIRLPYSMTKIALNNSGIESVTITDSWWTILNTYTYSGTQQDDIVILISSTDEDCSVVTPVDISTENDNTEIVDSGTLNTWLLTLDNTEIIIVPPENNTGTTESGDITLPIISTGSNYQSWIELSLSGTIDIVSTNTSITLESWSVFSELPTSTGTVIWIEVSNTGIYTSGAITDSGIIFPDIFPTIQYPTNALFSWGIFDCTDKLPCRINITFDPIFTGSILARDYICEVITDSGSMNTCNPNTLYFLTGSLFSLRIINKIDTSQSVTRSWWVIYSNILTSTINSWSVSGSEIDNPISNILDSWATDSGVLFPDIIPVFQNYTNTTNLWDILTCTTSPCRVNFTLDPIFTGSYLAKNYNCQIIYGTSIYDTCNPAQLYLIWTGSIDIIVTHKSSWQKSYRSLQIIQNIIPQNNSTNKITKNEFVIDTSPPIAVLEFDGKLKSYQDQIWEYEMNCYTSTCTINLSAEKSYDPEWWKLHFLWYYWLNDIVIHERENIDSEIIRYGSEWSMNQGTWHQYDTISMFLANEKK